MFREYFNSVRSQLAFRWHTFNKMFNYLDSLKHPVVILETGCVRGDSWGDGQSTILFDAYAKENTGSRVYSVNNDPEAAYYASTRSLSCTDIALCDSIQYLHRFGHTPDLVYLDSFDLSDAWPLPSAIHHLKELTAIMPRLRPETLVVVDDARVNSRGYLGDDGGFVELGKTFEGKARLIAEYAHAINVRPYFVGYQCGWLNLARLP